MDRGSLGDELNHKFPPHDPSWTTLDSRVGTLNLTTGFDTSDVPSILVSPLGLPFGLLKKKDSRFVGPVDAYRH